MKERHRCASGTMLGLFRGRNEAEGSIVSVEIKHTDKTDRIVDGPMPH